MNGVHRLVALVLARTVLVAPLLILTHPEARRPAGLVALALAGVVAAATVWLEPYWSALAGVGAVIGVHALGGASLAASLVVVLLLCCVHWGLRWGARALVAAGIVAAAGVTGWVLGRGSDLVATSAVGAGVCLSGVVVGVVVRHVIDRRSVTAALVDELRCARLRADTWADEYPRRRDEALRRLDAAVGSPARLLTLGDRASRSVVDDAEDGDIENDLIMSFCATVRSIAGDEADCDVRVVHDAAWIRMRAVVPDGRLETTGDDRRLQALRTLVEACHGVVTVVERPGHGAAVHARVPRLRADLVERPGGRVA